jgi:ferredoxin-NADP reductase
MKHGPGMHMMGGMGRKLATYEIAFKGKRKVAEGTYEYRFEKPAEFEFLAGQHVRMTLINPPESDAEGDKRFFTMASAPGDSDLLFAWRVRDTAFKRVADGLKPGDKVIVQKLISETPHGSFVLHDDATRPAVFIVGGIGIVPAYSMIKDATERKLPHRLVLFYSNRRPEDGPYLKELQELEQANPNFKLVATMTEAETSAQKWQGETGVIGRGMLKKYVPDLKAPIFYIAGLPEMARAMETMVKQAGVKEEDIRAEQFKGFDLNSIVDKPRQIGRLVVLIAIGLAVVAMIAFHLSAGGAALHKGLNITALVIVVLLLIAIKLFVMRKFSRRHGLKLFSHEPRRK